MSWFWARFASRQRRVSCDRRHRRNGRSGVALPAFWQDPVARDGWAIPAATDIAFALGVLALLGAACRWP